VNTSRLSAALPVPQTLPWSVASPVKTLWLFFRRKPLGALGSTIILVVVLTGVFGPLVAPYEPDDIGVAKKYAMPSWHGTLLGADQFGRDVLSRMLYGARISLVVGVVASTAGTLVGAILGLMSGYWGGRTDAIIQRFVDILMSFPLIILALTLLTALQRSSLQLLWRSASPSSLTAPVWCGLALWSSRKCNSWKRRGPLAAAISALLRGISRQAACLSTLSSSLASLV